VRSPTGVALQGTPALFSSHGVLGFCSGGRERGTVSQNDTVLFSFFIIIIIIYFICGTQNGLQHFVYRFW